MTVGEEGVDPGAAPGAARVLALVSAVFWGVLFFGLIDLVVAIDQTPGFYQSYVLEAGWGILFTFLVAVPLSALAWAPRLGVPLLHIAVVAAAVAVAALLSGAPLQLLPAGGLALDAAALLFLARGRLRPGGLKRPLRFDRWLVVFALLLLPVALVYAGDMVAGFREGRAPTDDITWGLDHWPMQAAMGLAVAGVTLLVAGAAPQRWSGTAVSAATVSISAGWFGLVCVAYPDHPASVGTAWGWVTVAWATGFTVTALRALRRDWSTS